MNPNHLWFNEARFGMFIHWGAYSVAGRAEWFRNRERIPQDEYIRLYAENFHAEKYDPASWAALAKETGMGYVVLTTRHHDGFSLWPTLTDDFHAGNFGPKRDLIAPFVEAVRAAGLKVGLYYSPADWHHPDYPGAYFRDWPGEKDWASPEARERFIAYYRTQLVELMSNYGKIDYLWFDGCIPDDLKRTEVNEELLRLQPHMLINTRNGPPSHVRISEQAIRPPKDEDALWEACMTLNESWGWHAGDDYWKDARMVVKLLCETAKDGGNLLLNIGPRPDGTIPEDSVRILRDVGDWFSRNRDAVTRSERSPFSWNTWGFATVKGSRIYLILRKSHGSEICWSELNNKVLRAWWLEAGSPVEFEQKGPRLFLRGLPVPLPDRIATTLVLEVEGKPEALSAQTTFWIPGEDV